MLASVGWLEVARWRWNEMVIERWSKMEAIVMLLT